MGISWEQHVNICDGLLSHRERIVTYILVKYSKLRTGFYSYAEIFLCPLKNINKSIKIIIYQNQIDNMRYTMVSSQALSISDTTRFRVEKKNK